MVGFKVKTDMDKQGRILIPSFVREQCNYNPGDIFEIMVEDGRIVLTKIKEEK